VTAPRPAVLVVEDESIVAHDLRRTLAGFGYDAYAVASSAEQALASAARKRPDVVLADIRIKGRLDGIATVQLLKKQADVSVIYLTAHADDVTLERAKQTRPHGYLMKPVNAAELKSIMESAVFKPEPEPMARPLAGAAAAAPAPAARPGRAVGARAVRRQLEQVFSSPDFDASRRSREFLRFIVEETLAGHEDDLTQFSIATHVFARPADFDAVVDPIVRVQAGRLRRSLERYYMLSGKNDPVRIDLKLGTYIPTFRAQALLEAVGAERAPDPAPPSLPADDWPSVAIGAFAPGTPGTVDAEAAARVTEALVLELGRHHDLRVLCEADQEASGRPRARFAIQGRARIEDGDLLVTTQLLDRVTGEQAWGDEFHTAPRPGRWSGTLGDIGQVIAARVGSEEGVIVQLLAAERRKRPAATTSYEAMLLSHEFLMAGHPETLATTLQALRHLVDADPGCGVAWTRLARLYNSNHAFEVTAIPTPMDQAVAYAQQGVRIDPASRRARCVLATALLITGELGAARDELEEALRLSPDSLVYLEVIGSLLAVLGDSERGPALIRTARHRNPYCLPLASFGLWYDHLRRRDFDGAYQAALEHRDPAFFWRALMRACCLGHLGRTADAQLEVRELLRRKPDFQGRGRILIGHYVKEPEVMDRIVDGLARAGLTLA